MNLNQILPGKTFRVKLSEPEVRMTLRELCGSQWNDCPFKGEVYENSFSIMENYSGIRKGFKGIILDGYFYEEKGRTTISVSPRLRPSDLVMWLLFAIVSASFFLSGIAGMASSLFSEGGGDGFTSFLTAVAGCVFLGIIYSLSIGSYQRSLEKIQKAFRAAQRHE